VTGSPTRLASPDDDALAAAIAAIRADLHLESGFPPAVEREAEQAAREVVLPEPDLTDVPFVTIDPEGATDLDQALHLERSGDGYRVRYAIADVPAFVAPLGEVDAEARKRGQTMYSPDGRIPLHPTVISEHAASLLPDEVRGAFVWDFQLAADTSVVSCTVSRARIRSRQQLSYVDAQKAIDDGTAPESYGLLKEIGEGRIGIERARGGASLVRPEQIVSLVDGRYELERRRPLPAEDWNAQLSLMTGMAAADLMLAGRIGILRTLPAADPDTIEQFRRQSVALGKPWPEDMPYGEYLRTLDPDDPQQLAITHAAGSLFRGAGYTAFDGELPKSTIQAAVGAPYAHATAPLRRLVDRFTLIVCEALSAGERPPSWVKDALPGLPAVMAASDSVASRLDNSSIDAVEAAVLRSRVGETFDASVVSARENRGVIQLTDPAVTANCDGRLVAGERIRATLVEADIAKGLVRFAVAS
jgi:exoribonuclease R